MFLARRGDTSNCNYTILGFTVFPSNEQTVQSKRKCLLQDKVLHNLFIFKFLKLS